MNIQLFSDNLNITIIYTNRQEHPNLLRMDKLNNHIPKSLRTFNTSQKLSTELSYTQIVRNIQLLADTLNITIIYANRQKHSTLLINYQLNYHIHKSSRTFNTSQKFSTELSHTQIVKNIQLLADTLNITIIYANRQNIQLFSEIINRTIICTNCQELSTVL
jgi:hypothetical protein